MTKEYLPQTYYDTATAAYYLGLSISTMKRMRKSGDGPTFYKFSRSVRYTSADLIEWAKANQSRVNRDFEYK